MIDEKIPPSIENFLDRKCKVLFWDDEAEGDKKNFFTNIKMGFEKIGWIAHIETDKNKIEMLVIENNYDAVVLDVLEKGKAVGLDILNHLRAKDYFLPIVIFTIHPEIKHITQALQGEVSNYLLYPIDDYRDVIRAIEVAIERENFKKKIINERYNASIGELAGGVAHYIKNSLWSIGSRAQILLEKTGKDSEDYELLEVIKRRCDDANKVVVDLLHFARRGESKPTSETFYVGDIVNEVLKLLEIETRQNKIQIVKKLELKEVRIQGDRFELKEAFLNVFKNAIEAMPGGGTISVDVTTSKEHITVKIEDQGKGMTPEVLENIFVPFYTTKENATGFGLYYTQWIIRKYTGTIYVKSNPNEGTIVTISLPLKENKK